jgi:transposase-like protein
MKGSIARFAALRQWDRVYGKDRYPPEIIQQEIWLYHRFTLSFRDVEDLLAERGIMVSNPRIANSCRSTHLLLSQWSPRPDR